MEQQHIVNISKTFNYRHDFKSEDLELLKNKYNHISFQNIPEAWIIILDDFLQKHSEKVKCVQQYFGYLSVIYKDDICINTSKDQKNTERRLEKIDMDLFQDLRMNYELEN